MNGNNKVLIVDDDPNYLEIFSATLAHEGLEISTASSGEEGINKARELAPALILCDMNMPGMSGADVVQALKADDRTKDAKLVFLTNLGGADDLSKQNNEAISHDLGASGYIMKSEDMPIIVEKVKSYLS